MKPTTLGLVSISFGIVVIGMIVGGHIPIMGVGVLFIILGGITRKPDGRTCVCPCCREPINPAASACPHCRRELGSQPVKQGKGHATSRFFVAAFAIILALGSAGPVAARKPRGQSATRQTSPNSPKVRVRGYTRKDGKYVAPYDRAAPGSGSHFYTSKNLGTLPYMALPPATGGSVGRILTPRTHGTHAAPGIQRDSHGKIKRSEGAKDSFKRHNPCPATGRSSGPCAGYVIDHIVPLCASGPDAAYNMRWQTIAEAKEKDRWERTECNAFPRRH